MINNVNCEHTFTYISRQIFRFVYKQFQSLAAHRYIVDIFYHNVLKLIQLAMNFGQSIKIFRFAIMLLKKENVKYDETDV